MLALSVLAAGPVVADCNSLYILGLAAAEKEHWRQVSILMTRAIDECDQAGGLVRPYGTWFEPYVPYYYLGLARFHLGNYQAALSSWNDSESQGPITYPRSKAKYRKMQELREQIPSLLVEQNRQLTARVEAALAVLDEIDQGVELTYRGNTPVGRKRSIVSIDEKRELLLDFKGQLEALASAFPEGVPPSATGQSRIEVLMQELEREIETLRIQIAPLLRLEKQYQASRAQFMEAESLLQDGACSPDAIDLLRRLAVDPADFSEIEHEPLDIHLALARAHLSCGQVAHAQQYLALANLVGLSSDSELSQVQLALEVALSDSSTLADPVEIEEPGSDRDLLLRYLIALTEFEAARALVERGGCSDEALSRLEAARNRYQALTDETPPTGKQVGPMPPSEATWARAYLLCGEFEAAERALDSARSSDPSRSHEIAELRRQIDEMRSFTPYAESHALVIVGSAYKQGGAAWDDLPGAAADGAEVEAGLRKQGFSVKLVEDPNASKLRKEIDSFIAKHGRKPGNRIVIYYAGHGYTERNEDAIVGYIVPVGTPDPETEDEAFEHLVNMDEFEGWANSIQAPHAMFIFDSCFGGTVFRTIETSPESFEVGIPSDPLAKKVKMFLTAGQEEDLVPDFSLFRRSLLNGLDGRADCNSDGVVQGTELGFHVTRSLKEAGSPTTPMWGKAKNLGSGDILFRKGAGLSCSSPSDGIGAIRIGGLATEVAFWEIALASRDSNRIAAYLETYPDGVFSQLARDYQSCLDTQDCALP